MTARRSVSIPLALVLRCVLALFVCTGVTMRVWAAESEEKAHGHEHQEMEQAAGMDAHAHEHGDQAELSDPHAHHHQMMEKMKHGQRSNLEVTLPDVRLVRQDGKTVSLPAELDDGRPVVLNFIFTSCTTICPLTSRIFSQLQTKLGTARVHMVSISIDPEQDTPARLLEYAKKYNAGPQWQHYTGSVVASIAVQRAFNAYYGEKMDHTPVTFLRAAHGNTWVRIDGFASADELANEFRQLVASR